MPESDITQLLTAWSSGDHEARDELFGVLYRDLHRLAHRALADQPNEATLDTTSLVHELYLRLAADFRPLDQNRARFFTLAAAVMRRILIDRARARLAAKRGSGERALTLAGDSPQPATSAEAEEVLAVNDALDQLEQRDPRLVRMVELRWFAGFSVEETAQVLEVSPRTVKRDWHKARALLEDWLIEVAGRPG